MTGSIKTLGVIGAGQMGCGIAQVSATAGYDVKLNDISLENAEAGKAKIVEAMDRAVGGGKMDKADADAAAARIVPVGTLEDLSEQYGVSRERIRQIEVRAFEKLQLRMRELAAGKGMLPPA